MDSVLRAIVVYLTLLLIFRISGKRALSETTTFDLVLTLIISETIQQALLDNDPSMTNALLVVIGLVGLDILVSIWKQRSPGFARVAEGAPLIIFEKGAMLTNRMTKERVDEEELRQAARSQHGLGRLDQVAYAVLETNGDISVIPRDRTRDQDR